MKFLLVKSNYKSVWAIHYYAETKAKHAVATKSVRLLPGINEVEEAEWNKVKNHKQVVAALDEGVLVVLQDPTKEDKPLDGLPSSLEKFSLKDACELVDGVMEIDVLKKWQKRETREAVKAALKKQIKELDKASESQPEG